jgi:hypothetical protein
MGYRFTVVAKETYLGPYSFLSDEWLQFAADFWIFLIKKVCTKRAIVSQTNFLSLEHVISDIDDFRGSKLYDQDIMRKYY